MLPPLNRKSGCSGASCDPCWESSTPFAVAPGLTGFTTGELLYTNVVSLRISRKPTLQKKQPGVNMNVKKLTALSIPPPNSKAVMRGVA